MDQSTVTQAIHLNVDGLEQVIEERHQEDNPFLVIAIVLATHWDEHTVIDQPIPLYITPECGMSDDPIEKPLSREDFLTLIRKAARDFRACAVIRGYYRCKLGGPAVSIELPDGEFQMAAPVSMNVPHWFWAKRMHQLDEATLPENIDN